MKKRLLFIVSHGLAIAVGFAIGIYALPILTAPAAPSTADLVASSTQASYKGQFRRDLKGSDLFHWGEGTVSVGPRSVSLQGRLAPGPDYKLYLSPAFVETEADFRRLKKDMLRVGDVQTFENFLVEFAEPVDVSRYNTVIVWCESFGQFITAAQYR